MSAKRSNSQIVMDTLVAACTPDNPVFHAFSSLLRDNTELRATAEQAEKALAEAVNYLKRVVQADRDDTKMGYPIPGDSCLAACIGLEVMLFLDDIGALTDAVSKHLTPSEPGQGSSGDRTSSGDERDSPASVRPLGDTASVSAPDIDALADTVRRVWVQAPLFSGLCVQKLFKSYVNVAEPALDSLVAIAKEADRERDEANNWNRGVIERSGLRERAERAERERESAQENEDYLRHSWVVSENARKAERAGRKAAEARVAALEAALAEATNAVAHLNGMVDWRDFGGDDGQGHYEGDYRAEQIHDDVLRWQSLASPDTRRRNYEQLRP